MWEEIEDSGGCCGFVTTVKDVEGWKIYRHGCLRLNKELLQMKPND